MQNNTIQIAEKGQASPSTFGPRLAFAISVLIAFAALAAPTTIVPSDLARPLASTLLFTLAGLIAIVGWRGGHEGDQGPLTYRDVAGALTLIGTFAASLIDPDQMVRVAEGAYRQN